MHATRDGVLLAFHDDVLDRVTDRSGAHRGRDVRRDPGGAIGGREQIPTLAELFDAFPDVRFNIDLKSDAAGAAAGRFLDERDAYDRVLVGLVLAAPAATVPAAHAAAACATSAHPLEVVAVPASCRRAGWPTGHPGPGRRAAGPAPPRPGHGHHARPGPARARGRASTCTHGPSTTPPR